MCCVNCFILLSGFFSVKLKWRSILNIYVTLISIFIPFYLFECIRLHTFSFATLLSWIECFSKSGYFIQNYVLLMFFSPLLNAFVEKEGKRILLWTLSFVAIEFYTECIQHIDTIGFGRGYSFLHFILMYMIGRCINMHISSLQKIKSFFWFIGYILCALFASILYIINIGHTWGYCNPLTIGSSICLFIPFTYHHFYNKHINQIAKSTLAVYIMQCLNPLFIVLCTIDKRLLEVFSYGGYLITSLLTITIVFFACITYDKIRSFVTDPITKYIYKHFNI